MEYQKKEAGNVESKSKTNLDFSYLDNQPEPVVKQILRNALKDATYTQAMQILKSLEKTSKKYRNLAYSEEFKPFLTILRERDNQLLVTLNESPILRPYTTYGDLWKQMDFSAIIDLIKAGADPNLHNKYGDTALHMAILTRHEDRIKELLELGANVDAEREYNESLPWYSEFGFRHPNIEDARYRDHYADTALHLAAYYNLKNVGKLLIDAGADVNAQNSRGDTPLHLAAKSYSIEMIVMLLNSGAKIMTNKTHNTPTDFAENSVCKKLDKEKMIRLLRQAERVQNFKEEKDKCNIQ